MPKAYHAIRVRGIPFCCGASADLAVVKQLLLDLNVGVIGRFAVRYAYSQLVLYTVVRAAFYLFLR